MNRVIYVYCRNTETGAEDLCSTHPDWKSAANRILQLYSMDANAKVLGKYYYFAKER